MAERRFDASLKANNETSMSTARVRPLGFEPRTCGLRVRCSAVELEARRVNYTTREHETKKVSGERLVPNAENPTGGVPIGFSFGVSEGT